MGKEGINKEWTEVLEKKEIQKIKQNDLREILYLRIALLCVIPAYILRIIQSIFIIIEYTSTAYKIGYVLFMLVYTAVFAGMFMFYHSLRKDIIKKYLGTIWKTSGIVMKKKKKENMQDYYVVKCKKFGEECEYTYSCQIGKEDIEIGDTITVVGCEREKAFHILTICKNENYFESRGWMLIIMNIMIVVGMLIFSPWSSRFGISVIYCLILGNIVCVVAFFTNLIAGIFEKDRLGIGISFICIIIFLLFQGPQNLYSAFLDLYEGAVVIENAEVSFEYKKTSARRGNAFLYYAVLSKGTELDAYRIRLPEAVYRYYTDVFKRPDYIVYYKNSGILVRFGK